MFQHVFHYPSKLINHGRHEKDANIISQRASEDGNFAAATCDSGIETASPGALAVLEGSLKDAAATDAKWARSGCGAGMLGQEDEGDCTLGGGSRAVVCMAWAVWSKRPSPGRRISGLLICGISLCTCSGVFQSTWPTLPFTCPGCKVCNRVRPEPTGPTGPTELISSHRGVTVTTRAEAGGVECPEGPRRAVVGGEASPGRDQAVVPSCGCGLCHTAWVT